MIVYVLRRLLFSIPVLLGLTLLNFVIARILPGDPVGLAAGPNASPQDIAALAKEFGLDQPMLVQYWSYLQGLFTGDWGVSIFTRRPVLDDLLVFLPATIELVLAAMFIAIVVGIPLGVWAAVRESGVVDHSARVVSLLGLAVPRFFLALLFQLIFAMWLGWLPLSGRFPIIETPPPSVTGLMTLDALISGQFGAFVTALSHLILPALAMALSPLATIMRMMRASMIEVMQQDYILNERALGLSKVLIVAKYALRNALSSSVTLIGLNMGWVLGGTVLVETVFDWPGIGLYATQAVLTQDFMPIIGVTLCVGGLFIVINLLVDIINGLLNPKVRDR